MSLVEAQEDWEEVNIEFLHSYKTYNLARKAAILAVEDKPIDSNIETDYEKPRKRQLPIRFTQTSDDVDWEPENVHAKRKQVVAGSSREMQHVNEKRKNCEDISQKSNVPAPAANIRKQLAALKDEVFKKALKSNGSHLNKKKFFTKKKLIKVINDKVLPQKSPLKEIFINNEKSLTDVGNTNPTDLPSTSQHTSFHASNTSNLSLDSQNITSNVEILPGTQTEYEVSSILQKLRDQKQQSEIFKSSDERSDNDIWKFEEHMPAEQNFSSRESSVKIDSLKSLEGSDDFFCEKGKRSVESTEITLDFIDNIVKVQEEIRIKLDHLEVKLDRILRKLFPEEIKLKRPHGIPAFRLRTEEEWENLEEILTDDNAFLYVVDVFTAKIKSQESEVASVQSVLPKIIMNSLSRCISWGGTQKTKIAFNKSKTYEAIQASILQKFGKTTNLKKPEDYVKRWFNTSSQRVV
ncbi:uncharacterized protein LOC118646309 [Monomorium pharaonis]|uniref:uncharacterized protein LOC118646309 n=1 Tax=Monomorium pharaonis TaxID=307658 RepID=UPI001745C789|nr:uncharacterized protein LOC118646309 [Monomorium pharaonis]